MTLVADNAELITSGMGASRGFHNYPLITSMAAWSGHVLGHVRTTSKFVGVSL